MYYIYSYRACQHDFIYSFQQGWFMAKKKQEHGGKRKGAGRKAGPDGPTMMVAVTVPESLVEQLDRVAKKNDWGRSQAVTEAIRGFVGKRT
jgi:hypothetical protein